MADDPLGDSWPDLTELELKIGRKTPESLLVWMRDAAGGCADGRRCEAAGRDKRGCDPLSARISSLKQEMRWLRSADVRILRQLVAVHEGIEAMRWLLEERGPLTSSLTGSLSSLSTVDEHGPSTSPCRVSGPRRDLEPVGLGWPPGSRSGTSGPRRPAGSQASPRTPRAIAERRRRLSSESAGEGKDFPKCGTGYGRCFGNAFDGFPPFSQLQNGVLFIQRQRSGLHVGLPLTANAAFTSESQRESPTCLQELTETAGENSVDPTPEDTGLGDSNRKSYLGILRSESNDATPLSPSSSDFVVSHSAPRSRGQTTFSPANSLVTAGEPKIRPQDLSSKPPCGKKYRGDTIRRVLNRARGSVEADSFAPTQQTQDTFTKEEGAPSNGKLLLGYDAQWCWVESQDDVTFV